MPKNKKIHITYIGRLEKEKGIQILIDTIERSLDQKRDIVWHICGDGSYMSKLKKLEKYEKLDIRIYGHIDESKITEILSDTDLVIMPSLFMETFGLVALESLSQGVPVCGFAHGGLSEFIHPSLQLSIDNPVDSFFAILENGDFPLMDISAFSHNRWIVNLRELTEGYNKILLVSDYITPVGGAEQYISDLTLSLRDIGKEVEIYGYDRSVNSLIRISLMLMTPFAFWRGLTLKRKIKKFNPDLIWMHSTLRYIGPYGVREIVHASCSKYITHHDLGLIAPRPSRVFDYSDIPRSPGIGDWMSLGQMNIFDIFSITCKWSLVSVIWHFLNMEKKDNQNPFAQSNRVTHIVPSHWMQSLFHKYSTSLPIIFPHTSKKTNPVKQ